MLFKQSPLVITFAFISNGLAYSFFVITLPVIGRQLQFSDTNTGFILGLSALVITIVSPLWGQACESWGRRKVILGGMIATAMFTILSVFIIQARLENILAIQTAFLLLLSVRLLNSVFTGGLKPGGQAYIADITTEENRSKGMGLMGAAFGIGSIMGGFTAMISGSDQLIEGYVFISVVVVFSSVLTLTKLPETHTQVTSRTLSPIMSLPYSKIWIFLCITLVGLTVFSLLQHIIGLTLQDKFQFSTDKAIKTSGMMIMISMLAMIMTQLFLIKKINCEPSILLFSGIVFSTIAMLATACIVILNAPAIPLLPITMVIFGLGLGLLFPGNLASLSINSGEQQQAAVAGVNGISQGLGLALGPVLAVALHKLNFFAPYLVCSFLLLSMLILLLLTYSKETISLVKERV